MHKGSQVLDRQYIPAGQIIFRQGTAGSQAFLIESGRVEAFVNGKDGAPRVVGEAGPGEIIGEMAIISGNARSASIRALEDCVLVAVAAENLQKAIYRKNSLFRKIMRIVDDRLKKNSENVRGGR